MAYATANDLIARVGNTAAVQLTTESGNLVDNTVVQAAVDAAQGDVDRHLARRFQTPIDVSLDADLAAALKAVTLDIGEYRLFAHRPPVSETKQKMYDNVVAWLEGVAKGDFNLPGAVTPASQTSDKPTTATGYSPGKGLGGEDGIQHW